MKWLAVCAALCGCGVQPVELAPQVESRDTITVGTPSADAVARLANADPGLAPPERLAFRSPNAALAVPENVAPLVFAWRSQGRPAPKPGANKDKATPSPPPSAAKADPPPPGMPMMDAPIAMPAAPAMPGMPAASTMPMMPTMPTMPTPPSASAYALVLRSAGRELLRLYTDAPQASFPIDAWRNALSNQVGQVLELELRALFEPGDEVLRTDPIAIEVRGPVPTGALYAFSTTAQGIVRASIEQARSTLLPIAADAAGHCIGCHAVSRDGRKLLAAASGEADLTLAALDAATTSALTLPVPPTGGEYVFGSFDPGGTRIAVSSAGNLYILDANSGATLGSSHWPDVAVTQPDWSPDGQFIALSVTAVAAAMPAPAMKGRANGADIARVAVAGDSSLGAPELLNTPPKAKDATRSFPSYSPDAAWLAFEQRMGPMAATDGGRLWIMPGGGGGALELGHAAAHEASGGADGWPSWMPGDRAERPFLVFASSRAADGGELRDGRRQLFASALDLTLAAAGQDPSSAAFWLPFQAPGSSYRHALWAPTANSCLAQTEVCDGRDDDCDDRIDEACCDATSEQCADGVDDDCDGAIDEGCSCAPRDVCDNGADDDCDGSVDEQPCTPAMHQGP